MSLEPYIYDSGPNYPNVNGSYATTSTYASNFTTAYSESAENQVRHNS